MNLSYLFKFLLFLSLIFNLLGLTVCKKVKSILISLIKYLLIEFDSKYIRYDQVHRRFTSPVTYPFLPNPPLREYIVSFRSFMLAGELDPDLEGQEENNEVKLGFIWTRPRYEFEIGDFNYDIPWEAINQNLEEYSNHIFDQTGSYLVVAICCRNIFSSYLFRTE